MDVMKDCPYCTETVRADARICKHCHSNLAGSFEGIFVMVRLKGGDKIYRAKPADIHTGFIDY